MAEITAGMVKELREKTGVGMMDCKKALAATDGDIEAAVNWLREKGLASAVKKAGRVAAEGLVGINVTNGVAAMVEINCETDFVAKNPEFQALIADMAQHVAVKAPGKVRASDAGDGPVLEEQGFIKDEGTSVADTVKSKIATIGENISLRRFFRVAGADAVGVYSHGGGNIGVIVSLRSEKGGSDALNDLAREIAMHVSFTAPRFLNRDEVDTATLDNERAIFRQKAIEEGKPADKLDRIVDGQINKFFAESCLLEQVFIKDESNKNPATIAKLLEKASKETGGTVTIGVYARFKVGEGIEKKQDNLAAEVAKMMA